MIFRNKQKRIANQLAQQSSGSYAWNRVKRSFFRNRLAKLSLCLFAGLLFIAIFADFLANEKPILCQLEGEWQSPIIQQYLIDIGIDSYEADFRTKRWLQTKYDFVLFAPIPYSSTYQDRRNRNLVSPFEEQRIASWRFRHWLGTDKLGRDVCAGLVSGTRIALLVGMGTMTIAALIGIFLGGLGGFFGDRQLRISWLSTLFLLIGLFVASFYTFISPISLVDEESSPLLSIGSRFLLFVGMVGFFGILSFIIDRRWNGHSFYFPLDSFVMRLIEIVNSIPALLLLLAVIAIIRRPSLTYVIFLLGILSWTGIARFIRAELLRIRELEYIQSARALGFSDWHIFFHHALPNALSPVLIVLAFGMAGAILAEASLSFLGIGIPTDVVSWGSMLKSARESFSAWWLAIFPGLAIFITVSMFNFIGDGLTKALSAK
jgi:peptide/nickel transport system permease protein